VRWALSLLVGWVSLVWAAGPLDNLFANLKGFTPQPTELQKTQKPYPGWKICRVLAHSLQGYFGGGTVQQSAQLLYPASVTETERAVSSAAVSAKLKVVHDWHADFKNRPEYFRNDLVPYGFQALELAALGKPRLFVGVTDHHKNHSGLSAVCVMSFEP